MMDSWQPDKLVVRLVSIGPRIRAAPGNMFIASACFYMFSRGGSTVDGLLNAAGLLSFIGLVAQLRTLPPRKTVEATYDSTALRVLAAYMQVPEPRVVMKRGGRTAHVRGSSSKPALVLSPKVARFWEVNPAAHTVQLAHEMAHVWAQDVGKYYARTTGVMVSAVVVTTLRWRNGGRIAPDLVAAVIALASTRLYLRGREFAADLIAGQVVGLGVRDQIPLTALPDSGPLSQFGTHPSPAERRRVFEEPAVVLSDLILSVWAMGFLSFHAADRLTVSLSRAFPGWSGRSCLYVAIAVLAAYAATVIGAALPFLLFLVDNFSMRRWVRALLVGSSFALLAFGLPHVEWRLFLAACFTSVVLSRVFAPLGLLLMWKSDADVRDSPVKTFKYGCVPAVAWCVFVVVGVHGFYRWLADFL